MNQLNSRPMNGKDSNLVYMGGGVYLSKSDPHFWEKYLNYYPNDKEALYNIGLNKEKKANYYLDRYFETNDEKYLSLYDKNMQEAYTWFKKCWAIHSYQQAFDNMNKVIQQKEHVKKNINQIRKQKKGKKTVTLTKGELTGIIILSFLVGFIIAMIWGLILFQDNSFFSYNPISKPIESSSNVELIGMGGVAKNKTVTQHKDKNTIQLHVNEEDDYFLWETATVLRSALLRFAEDKGYFPDSLNELTKSFPENYLSAIPLEPYTLSNTIVKERTNKGGWIYLKEDTLSANLEEQVAKMIVPNLPLSKEIPFEPVEIKISKNDNKIYLMSGDKVLRDYSITIGKEGLPNDEDLHIERKIMHPNSILLSRDKNPYGTRAMELSNEDSAIHGAIDPNNVKEPFSMDCVRMNEEEMEELYAMTPLSTSVVILDEFKPETKKMEYTNTNKLYKMDDNPYEKDNRTLYIW